MSYGIQGNVHPDQTPNLIVQMGSMDNISKEYVKELEDQLLQLRIENAFLKEEATELLIT